MSPDQIVVTLGAVALIAAIVWFFWLKREDGVRATVAMESLPKRLSSILEAIFVGAGNLLVQSR